MRLFKKCFVVIGILLLILSGYIIFRSDTFIEDASTNNGWNLVLVNHTSKIPDNYKVILTKLNNGKEVDSRIVPELSQMFRDARKDDIYMQVNEGYRSSRSQQKILDNRTNYYKNKGLFTLLARRYALNYVSAPGTSEHQLGLAVDIIGDNRYTTNQSAYRWLERNAYKYGFIQRYPKNKTSITHIKHEPWHYRYVGKKAALKMHQKNICLEEYVESL